MWPYGIWGGVSILPMDVDGSMTDYQLCCRVLAYIRQQEAANAEFKAALSALDARVAALEAKVRQVAAAIDA